MQTHHVSKKNVMLLPLKQDASWYISGIGNLLHLGQLCTLFDNIFLSHSKKQTVIELSLL